MSAKRELYHDGAKCPECGERVGTPDLPENRPDDYPANHLECASCGHDWEEANVREIARAWFAHGAYEQSQRQQNPRDKGAQVPASLVEVGEGQATFAIKGKAFERLLARSLYKRVVITIEDHDMAAQRVKRAEEETGDER